MRLSLGLLGGSITLAGGHGTGATYAEKFAGEMNVQGAMELAMACATFGLVVAMVSGSCSTSQSAPCIRPRLRVTN